MAYFSIGNISKRKKFFVDQNHHIVIKMPRYNFDILKDLVFYGDNYGVLPLRDARRGRGTR